MVLGFPNDLPKKWSKSGLGIFWAFPNDLPKKWSKSAQKVVQKWPQQDLGAKNCPKSCKTFEENYRDLGAKNYRDSGKTRAVGARNYTLTAQDPKQRGYLDSLNWIH